MVYAMAVRGSEYDIVGDEAVIAHDDVFGFGKDEVCPSVEVVVFPDEAHVVLVKGNVY